VALTFNDAISEDKMEATIQGQAKLASVVGKAGFTAFSKVCSLTFFEDPETRRPGYSLLLVLETDRSSQNYRLRLRFTGIKEFRIREFGGCPTQITGLSIRDVSNRQLEGIRLEVIDYEHDVIRFFCDTAEVHEVERISRTAEG
jgi:hypothetical protein